MDYFIFNICSILISDSWSKRKFCQVSSNSDSCWENHRSFIWWEIWSINLTVWILSFMSIIKSMTMIVFDNLIKKFIESWVWIMRTCIYSNSRVNVLTSWENCILEWEVGRITFIFVLIPNFSCEIFTK